MLSKTKTQSIAENDEIFQRYGSAGNIVLSHSEAKEPYGSFFLNTGSSKSSCPSKAFLKRGRSKFFPKKEILFLFLLISRKKNLGENYVMLGIKANCQG